MSGTSVRPQRVAEALRWRGMRDELQFPPVNWLSDMIYNQENIHTRGKLLREYYQRLVTTALPLLDDETLRMLLGGLTQQGAEEAPTLGGP